MGAESAAPAMLGIRYAGAEEQAGEVVRELVLRARSGDAAAFESLMLRFQKQVVGTALRLLGNPDDARDASQEVFLRLYKHLRSLDPERSIAGWLYRVTINACRDLGRRRGSGRQLPLDSDSTAGEREWTAGGGAEEQLVLSEEWHILQAALGSLPEKERAALVLRDVEGLETREVARILGTSEITVRTHVCRARLRLRKRLEGVLGRRRT